MSRLKNLQTVALVVAHDVDLVVAVVIGDNEVHVVSNYESDSLQVSEPGLANLRLTVTGRSSRPLVLVLTSYEPVEWVLNIPVGVVIDRVIIVSVVFDCWCDYYGWWVRDTPESRHTLISKPSDMGV